MRTSRGFERANGGAYGIQGRAGLFFEQLAGSYTGVMGLPLFETGALLKRFNYPL